jgi:hypothetical protein
VAQAGGTTNGSLSNVATTGPAFTALGPDIAQVEDLSSDTASFNAGRQILMIVSTAGTEICYVDSITSLGGSNWQINNLVRARQGTTALTHPAGARVYIFSFDDVPKVSDVVIYSGATVYVKPVPDGVSLADVTAKSILVS